MLPTETEYRHSQEHTNPIRNRKYFKPKQRQINESKFLEIVDRRLYKALLRAERRYCGHKHRLNFISSVLTDSEYDMINKNIPFPLGYLYQVEFHTNEIRFIDSGKYSHSSRSYETRSFIIKWSK
jgi:hypothetical protein